MTNHDALRQLNVLVSACGSDVERFLDDPSSYDAKEYFPSVLEALNDALDLVVLVRSELRSNS